MPHLPNPYSDKVKTYISIEALAVNPVKYQTGS